MVVTTTTIPVPPAGYPQNTAVPGLHMPQPQPMYVSIYGLHHKTCKTIHNFSLKFSQVCSTNSVSAFTKCHRTLSRCSRSRLIFYLIGQINFFSKNLIWNSPSNFTVDMNPPSYDQVVRGIDAYQKPLPYNPNFAGQL